MAEHHQVLFCPFCRESFEGRSSCPEHDVTLVPFDKLPPDSLDPDAMTHGVDDDTPLGTFDPRFGRAWVGLGALLVALSLVFEFVRGVDGSSGLSTHELAITAPSLWTLLLVTFTLLFILRRRRTPRGMRAMRVLVPALALIPPVTVAWVLYRLESGAVVWATGGRHIGMSLGTAVYVIGLGSLLVFIGGLRLGVLPRD
jgi:hypothetical protein